MHIKQMPNQVWLIMSFTTTYGGLNSLIIMIYL